MRRALAILLATVSLAVADDCPRGRTPNLCLKPTAQQLLNDNFTRIDEVVGAVVPAPWTPQSLGRIDAGTCRTANVTVTDATARACSNDTSVHTFAVWNDSGGGMKQVFIIENNGDGGLNGTATDVDFRNAVVNMGTTNATLGGATTMLFVSPTGQNFYSPLVIFPPGQTTAGNAAWRVGSTGAMVSLVNGLSSAAWTICANSDQSCTNILFRVTETGTMVWGSGSGSVDTQLGRISADVLGTPDSFRVAAFNRNVAQAVTVADDGAGTAAVATVTPTASYINITCNDANGCDLTMSETSMVDGTTLQLTNVSANTCNFADTSGVTELAGTFAAGQWDTIALRYVTDRWVETGRSNN